MRFGIILLAAAGLAATGSCRQADEAGSPAHYADVEARVPPGHVHDAYCGHYFHEGKWYHPHGHRHGPGCGHVFLGGNWTIRQ